MIVPHQNGSFSSSRVILATADDCATADDTAAGEDDDDDANHDVGGKYSSLARHR